MNKRKYWVSMLDKIAFPVLDATSKRQLHTLMPPHEEMKNGKTQRSDVRPTMFLEAIGRTLNGIAPWLEADLPDGEEKILRDKYCSMAREAIDAVCDPASKDYCVWFREETSGNPDQPLVDAAFLAQAILRAPTELFEKLEKRVKNNLISAMKETRKIYACHSNWLLFSAIIECFLYLAEGECDIMRLDFAVTEHMNYYKGDGFYGDGDEFFFNYYNSFVIHPMLDDVTRLCEKLLNKSYSQIRTQHLERMEIYARHLERMIAPDGSFPCIGRSITYRMGAFHALAHIMMKEYTTNSLSLSSVRNSLTKVIEKCMENESVFDKNGWLRPGLYGFEPELLDSYITTGSLYLCLFVFLPLGLSPSHPFWTDENSKSTWEKVWKTYN